MVELGPLAAEWLAGGALITLLGALIKFAGWTWLLAGYDESTSAVPDEIVQEMGETPCYASASPSSWVA